MCDTVQCHTEFMCLSMETEKGFCQQWGRRPDVGQLHSPVKAPITLLSGWAILAEDQAPVS